jgi:hypothetical protein
MKYTFKKENSRWYIDLPEYIEEGLGGKEDLEMVQGADTLLDILSSDSDSVTLDVREDYFGEASYILNKISSENIEDFQYCPVGQFYSVSLITLEEYNHVLWLCPVTEYVFEGRYPDNIYISIIN